MLDHNLVLSLTISAWLVAAATASEPLPQYQGQVDDAARRFESMVRPMPVTIDYVGNPSTEELPAAADSCSSCQTGGPRPALENWRDRVQTHHWESWGYPGEFLPVPLGMSYNACFNTQVLNGLAAQMVLYRYDFQQPQVDREPARLVARGQLRLSKMATLLASAPFPLIVEPSGDPALDAARRKYVLAELNKYLPDPMPAESVVTGIPRARGLSGAEALIIDDNLLQQTTSRGMSSVPSSPGRILAPIPAAPNINAPPR
jgi:hypothetical protein